MLPEELRHDWLNVTGGLNLFIFGSLLPVVTRSRIVVELVPPMLVGQCELPSQGVNVFMKNLENERKYDGGIPPVDNRSHKSLRMETHWEV